jgi:hypothetical protein
MFRFVCCALLVALFSGQASAIQLQLSDESEQGEFKVNYDYLFAEGEIEKKDPAAFRKILNARAAKGKRTVILLSSPGGILEVTPDLAAAILEPSQKLWKAKHFGNILVINDECSSACAALLTVLTAKHGDALQIIVDSKATFGFHSPVDKKNGKVVAIKDTHDREKAIQKQIGFFRKHGASSGWMNDHKDYFTSSQMTEVSGGKLCEEKSMIVPPNSCLSDENEDIMIYLDNKLAGPDAKLDIPQEKRSLTPAQDKAKAH